MLGSFLVPATFVAWAFERRESGEITADLIFRTFTVGGVLGVLAASVLENYLLRPSLTLFVGIGLIEEAVKLGALALLTRPLSVKSSRYGMILGPSVGFGFSAFESAGYALSALFTEQGLSVVELVTTELLRGLITPFGHALWTTTLGGMLFLPSNRDSFVLTLRLLGAYLEVSALHALWDSMHVLSVLITVLMTGRPWQYELLQMGWIPEPTDTQVLLLTMFTWLGLAAISVVGLLWLRALTRSARSSNATVPVGRYYVVSTRGRWWPGGTPPPDW